MVVGFLDLHYENMDESDLVRRTESLLYNMERILGAKEGSLAILKELSLDAK